jgi:hypothetical protein
MSTGLRKEKEADQEAASVIVGVEILIASGSVIEIEPKDTVRETKVQVLS